MSSLVDSTDKEEEEVNDFVTFTPFCSFRNSYVEKEVDYIRQFIPEEEEWVALEKIHGCNFSATTNVQNTKWASRSDYLDDKTLLSFNNAPIVVSKYSSKVEMLYQKLHDHFSGDGQVLSFIRVFGELYGGKYKGYDVKTRAIQKEISYCPDIEFVVFDIECIPAQQQQECKEEDEEGNQSERTSFFLNPVDVIHFCKGVDLPVLEILHCGSLNDMLALDPVFSTTIPTSLFDLPALEDNHAEGYVLKPKSQAYYKPDGTRVLLKHKNPRFTERSSKKVVKLPPQDKSDVDSVPEEAMQVFETMKQYINENRINAVLSKMDQTVKSRRKQVIFTIAKDAQDDINLEMESQLVNMSNKTMKKLNKMLISYTEKYCDEYCIDFLK